MHVRAGDRRSCVRHEDDNPMVDEFGFATPACSGSRLLAWPNVGDDVDF